MSTPSQTAGPFLSLGLDWPDGPYVVPDGTPGAFWIRGRVFDGAGDPVPDALVETWQVGPAGGRGFGRCATSAVGGYAVHTARPDEVDGQAPHLDVSVFARGLLHRVVTRIYLAVPGFDPAGDPVLAAVPVERRHTLVALPSADGYHFDVRLQGSSGADETVFFDV